MKTAGTCIVQSTSRSLSFWNTTVAKTAAVAALLWGGLSAEAASISWIGSSDDNYTNTSAWSTGVVPGVADTAIIGNGTLAAATVLYTNPLPVMFSTNRLTVFEMGTAAGSSTFTMTGGILWVTNATTTAFSLGNFNGAVDTFNQIGGTLVVARPSTSTAYFQDAALPGNVAGANGIYTNSGGVAYFLCGVEVGNTGSGTFSVNRGVVVDNGWFGQRGGGTATDSSTFNLNSGSMYVLRNTNTDTAANSGGLAFGQSGYNATANITGGNLYCTAIRFNNTSKNPKETVNMVGGTVFLGYLGVYTNGTGTGVGGTDAINISGGTFRTSDMLIVVSNNVVNNIGNTNTILSDGTNWSWAPTLGVVLKDNTFLVDGATGPGYVTFAPEATRTITLNNIWSGVGGLAMNGPGTLVVNGADTYSGSTMVNGGVLTVGASGSINGSSTIQIASGATLDGNGTVTGAISIGSGATIGGGYSTNIGALNITGATALSSGGTLTVKVQNAITGAGVGNDNVAVSGNIGVLATSGSKFTVKLVSLDGTGVVGNSVANFNNTTNYTWTIVTGTVTNFDSSAFTVDTSAFANALGGGQFFVGTTGSSLVVYFKPASTTVAGTAATLSNVAIVGTHPTFSGSGIPGYTYGVESSTTSPVGPWIEATNAIAGTNGVINVTDQSQTSPSQIYYRLYYPDNPSNPPQ